MEFICSRAEFAKGLRLAEYLADRVSTIPALHGILLETDKNILTIRATDLNTGFEMTVPARIKKEGGAVIPVRPSIQLVSAVAGDEVRVEVVDSMIHFTTQNTTSSVKGYLRDDFPKLPILKSGERILFSIADFLKATESVLFAASKSDIRPEISSVYIKGSPDGVVKVVATDSFRLAERSFKSGSTKAFSFLFPWRRLGEFVRILQQFTGTVECMFDGQQFFAAHSGFSYFTRLTEGKFPDYEQVIPRSFTTEVTLDRAELVENLKIAGIFGGQLKEVRFKAHPNDQLFEILTTDTEVGTHSSHVKAQVTGEGVEMSFNQRYVVEGLDPITSETVLLRFSGAAKPLVIQNPQDVSYLYLAMPMKGV